MASEGQQRGSVRPDAPDEDAIRAAQEYGIDISMLRDNLRRSYAERIRRHEIALKTVEKLRDARRV